MVRTFQIIVNLSFLFPLDNNLTKSNRIKSINIQEFNLLKILNFNLYFTSTEFLNWSTYLKRLESSTPSLSLIPTSPSFIPTFIPTSPSLKRHRLPSSLVENSYSYDYENYTPSFSPCNTYPSPCPSQNEYTKKHSTKKFRKNSFISNTNSGEITSLTPKIKSLSTDANVEVEWKDLVCKNLEEWLLCDSSPVPVNGVHNTPLLSASLSTSEEGTPLLPPPSPSPSPSLSTVQGLTTLKGQNYNQYIYQELSSNIWFLNPNYFSVSVREDGLDWIEYFNLL